MHPATLESPALLGLLPDHTQLPDKDGSIVTNVQEHPQSNLLTESLLPRLHEIHPAGDFCVASDVGIYYQSTDPPLDGCRAPDWFYVPGVPAMLNGLARRSYVLWKEIVKPLLLVEYVSGDGSEEHDATPNKGKFWVYERAVCASYYAIFDAKKATLEVFQLLDQRYRPMEPNDKGRYPIAPLGVELGLWHGRYRQIVLPWVRVWDAATGQMVVIGEERAEVAEAALEETRVMLTEQIDRADKLAAKLRALGIDPDA